MQGKASDFDTPPGGAPKFICQNRPQENSKAHIFIGFIHFFGQIHVVFCPQKPAIYGVFLSQPICK